MEHRKFTPKRLLQISAVISQLQPEEDSGACVLFRAAPRGLEKLHSLFSVQIPLPNTQPGSEGVQAAPSDKTPPGVGAEGLEGTSAAAGLGSGCWEGAGRYCSKD